jgi:hypothetical protein
MKLMVQSREIRRNRDRRKEENGDHDMARACAADKGYNGANVPHVYAAYEIVVRCLHTVTILL